MIENAEKQVIQIAKVRSKVRDIVMVIHENVAQVKALMNENLATRDSPGGVLVQGEDNYFNCVKLEGEKLNALLERDEAHWAENKELVTG